MRRLLIGFILLFAITVQAQEKRVEDWVVWLYFPDSGSLLFKGFYGEYGETVNYVPVSFEHDLQFPDNLQSPPETVIVSDDASTLAYVFLQTFDLGGTTSAKIIVSEVFEQGFYEHDISTFNTDSVSIAFHSNANIQRQGYALYNTQQRFPAFANHDPNRERIIAYAYQNIDDTWWLEVFDVNNEQLLYQFNETAIPELLAEKVTLHRYYGSALVFSTTNNNIERLYEWSISDNTIRQLPYHWQSTQNSDYLQDDNISLGIDGTSLRYYDTSNTRGNEIFSADGMHLPRFIQGGERVAVAQSNTSLSVLERDGTVLMPDFSVANISQLVSVPTGFVYAVENEAFSMVSYYHTVDDNFSADPLLIWGDFDTAEPVEIIYVHHGEQ